MRRAFLLVVLFAALPLPHVFADGPALVEALKMPAWVTRSGARLPLRAGMELRTGDVIETGGGARLLLQLPDGSLLKVGEDARLSIDALHRSSAIDAASEARIGMERGALRIATGAAPRTAPRTVHARVGATAFTIDGTDVWAQAGVRGEELCLIEGRVLVEHPLAGNFVMDQPLTLFDAPKGDAPRPVSPIDPDRLRASMAATDLKPGSGVTLPNGGWVVQLAAHGEEGVARGMQQKMTAAGYPAELTTVELKARTFFRLRIGGFDTQADARHFAAGITGQFGIANPWVTCTIPGSSCN